MVHINGTNASNESIEYDTYVKIHNDEINYQIEHLTLKVDSYIETQVSAKSIANQLEELSSNASSIGHCLENVIVNGRSIDGEGAFMSTSSNLMSMSSKFTNIANICSKKIDEIEEKISYLKTQFIT